MDLKSATVEVVRLRNLVEFNGAKNVTLSGFVFRHAARNPLFEYNQCQNRQAIDLTPGPKTDNYPADCVVEDCLIRHVGVVEKQATGVEISMARRITIRHCSIYDASRAGINIAVNNSFHPHVWYVDSGDVVTRNIWMGSYKPAGGMPSGNWGKLTFVRSQQTVTVTDYL